MERTLSVSTDKRNVLSLFSLFATPAPFTSFEELLSLNPSTYLYLSRGAKK